MRVSPRADFDLAQWLAWQGQLHPNTIDLGLSRCQQVAQRLQLTQPDFPVIIVGGTNGKGSSVAMLSAIYHQAGYKVGRYMSPEIWRYNERICIAQQTVTDAQLCAAFLQIDKARDDISLTAFEFSTLAAMLIFQQQQVDVAILEVGLGGRLDAVNSFDADVALVTKIGIDHIDWLGDDLEGIAYEKAGIFRQGKAAIYSSDPVPQRLQQHAHTIHAKLLCLSQDFNYQIDADTWQWFNQKQRYTLAKPALVGEFQYQNAAGVIQAIECLQTRLPVSSNHLSQGLRTVSLAGRFQQIATQPAVFIDVAHNPMAATALTAQLKQQTQVKRWTALVGMLKDKDIQNTLTPLVEVISHWHLLTLSNERAANPLLLQQVLEKLKQPVYQIHTQGQLAYQQILSTLAADEGLIVFGSFYTVAAVLKV